MKTKSLLIALFFAIGTSMAWSQTAPAAPIISSVATNGLNSFSVAFTLGADGGSAITNLKYSTDGGTTWLTRQVGTTFTPVLAPTVMYQTINTLSSDGTTKLVQGTAYNVLIKAVNAIGDGAPSNAITATYAFLLGAGTSVEPYRINNYADLSLFRNAIASAAGVGLATSYYVLTNDIDMTTATTWGGIGNTSANSFKGNFDGKGYTIKNFKLGTTTARYSSSSMALFINVDGATISNVALEATLYTQNAPSASGGGPVLAGLVATVNGTSTTIINNCKFTGTVDVLAMVPSTALVGTTTSTMCRAGGILGTINATAGIVAIINCTTNATIVSYNEATYNTTTASAVAGGIVGDVKDKPYSLYISNCTAEGSVTATSDITNSYVGGILGVYFAPTAIVNISNCVAKNSLFSNGGSGATNSTCVGGIVNAQNAASSVTNCIVLNNSINLMVPSGTLPNSTTVINPAYSRIIASPSLISVGTVTNNFARQGIPVYVNIAGVSTKYPLNSTDSTSKNGGNLDSTICKTLAFGRLSAYVTAHPTLTLTNATTNVTSPALKAWSSETTLIPTILTPVYTSIKSLSQDLVALNYAVAGNELKISGVEGSRLMCIYSLTGKLVKKALISDTYSTVLNNGIYILKVEGFAAAKVLVY